MNQPTTSKPTTFRWTIVGLLFLATTVNYLDRQVLSLTWKDFIAPEFHWDNNDYGNITALFSIFYAASMIFAGKFVDWMDTKKGSFGPSAFGLLVPFYTHFVVLQLPEFLPEIGL